MDVDVEWMFARSLVEGQNIAQSLQDVPDVPALRQLGVDFSIVFRVLFSGVDS